MLLGVAIWRLMVLQNQVLIGEDLKHALNEAMVELLSVVLHDNISVSSNIRSLATLSCGVCCWLFNFIIKTLQSVVLLVGLIALFKVVNNQLDALYENSLV